MKCLYREFIIILLTQSLIISILFLNKKTYVFDIVNCDFKHTL